MVMESLDLYSLTSSSSYHLMESEEDFHFGAKTSSFLPPATAIHGSTPNTTTATIATHSFDLPEWMEGRELLELPDTGLFGNTVSPQPLAPQDNSLIKIQDDKDDYCFTIKPEDMLVPLSELQQPPATPSTPPPLADTPPASPLQFTTTSSPVFVPDTPPPPLVPSSPPPAAAYHTQASSAPLPKIIICRKVDTHSLKHRPIRVSYQVMPVKQVPSITLEAPLPEHSLGSQGDMPVEPQATVSSFEVQQPQGGGQPCDAEELINEIVEMIGTDNNSAASTIFQGLDTEVEADMEALLLQLEASNKETLSSEPLPQATLSVPLPTPSPSTVASLSPLSTETTVSAFLSPPHSESPFPSSPFSLPSPVPSLDPLSPAQSSCDTLETSSVEDCLEEEWSPLEDTHSYSKSSRKARPARRSKAARKTPYPEDRKERKKEQNKQAALRYRQKKKQEEDDLASKIRAEEERRERLTTTYKDLKQELSYLKKIMREMFVAKGLVSEEALEKAALEMKKKKKKACK